eukprot:4589950-Alexandrium_andersonii.AAC.1
MSASLVGSEMCIRDRGGPHGARRGANDDTEDTGLLGHDGGLLGAREANPCLLYTSDAADDM